MAVFLSCDWGTSSFRLRLVETEPFRVVAAVRTDEGAATLRDRSVRERLPAGDVFREVLEKRASELLSPHLLAQSTLRPARVLVSGMASSTIGWLQAPYAGLPFPADGSAMTFVEVGEIEASRARLRVTLLGGLAAERDVMRGEETEVVGLLSGPDHEHLRRDSLLVLPGTHSKHVRVEAGSITGFATYMTGEVYAVLSRHSILRHSLAEGSPLDRDAFLEGGRAAREPGVLQGLFKVRANQVLGGMDPARNASFLSGLLVTAEALDAAGRTRAGAPVVICANPALSLPYRLAFESLDLGRRLEVLSEKDVDESSARGHTALLEGRFTQARAR